MSPNYFEVAWGPHFKGLQAIFYSIMLKIGLYGIYSKVKPMGAIVSKLESRSLEQNIAREAGDESLFFAKLVVFSGVRSATHEDLKTPKIWPSKSLLKIWSAAPLNNR